MPARSSARRAMAVCPPEQCMDRLYHTWPRGMLRNDYRSHASIRHERRASRYNRTLRMATEKNGWGGRAMAHDERDKDVAARYLAGNTALRRALCIADDADLEPRYLG